MMQRKAPCAYPLFHLDLETEGALAAAVIARRKGSPSAVVFAAARRYFLPAVIFAAEGEALSVRKILADADALQGQ